MKTRIISIIIILVLLFGMIQVAKHADNRIVPTGKDQVITEEIEETEENFLQIEEPEEEAQEEAGAVENYITWQNAVFEIGEDRNGWEEEIGGEEVTGEQDNSEIDDEYANLAIAKVTNYVNIRKEPNTDSEVLGKIYAGAVAEVLEVSGEDNEWFHIVSGEVEGYIKAEYFYYGQEAVDHVDEYVTYYATVTADRLNVRKEQDKESKRIGYIDFGEKVRVLENCGEWIKVAYTDDKEGFVSAEFVTISEEFTYGISIEEERRLEAERKALEERAKASEESKPEKAEHVVVSAPSNNYGSNSELRSAIVDYAKQYEGMKYVHGGKSLQDGTDCSGFTCFVYKEFGINISRTPSGQYTGDGRSISYEELQPGDIVCYGDSKCTHVGLYIGGGQIIHEANSKKGCIISNVDYMKNILGYKNVID